MFIICVGHLILIYGSIVKFCKKTTVESSIINRLCQNWYIKVLWKFLCVEDLSSSSNASFMAIISAGVIFCTIINLLLRTDKCKWSNDEYIYYSFMLFDWDEYVYIIDTIIMGFAIVFKYCINTIFYLIRLV